MNEICKDCPNKRICLMEETQCQAMEELRIVQATQSLKDRAIFTRLLARKLGIRDAVPSKEMKQLGEAIISKFPELHFINTYGIKIGYVLSYENKCGQKITYADCRKLGEVYKAFLPFDFIVTFYYFNTELLTENQKKIVMLHELKHIQINERGLSVRPHETEDFKDILRKFGLDWNEVNQEVPDILGGE
jgi:hypothetical protein